MDSASPVLTILDDNFIELGTWFEGFAESVGVVLVAAAAIYLAYIGWRAFRKGVNGV